MTRYTFPSIKRRAEKVGACPVCGKRSQKAKTFENTVNPWNRNTDGSPRSFDEVTEHVKQLATDWIPDFTHANCMPERRNAGSES